MCAMKYSCRSTQNSEEGRAQTAPRQTRKSPRGIAARKKRAGVNKRIYRIIFMAIVRNKML